MEFPVVLVRHLYESTEKSHSSYVTCNDSYYGKPLTQLIKIKGTQGLKTECGVLVYIAPNICHTWKRSQTDVAARVFGTDIRNRATNANGQYIVPALRNFRSGCFTILVGHKDTAVQPIFDNWFSELDSWFSAILSVSVRSKIFVLIETNGREICAIKGMFLLVPPTGLFHIHSHDGPFLGSDSINSINVLSGIFYGFRRINWVLSPPQIDEILFQLISKSEMLWYQLCVHCRQTSRSVMNGESECPRKWRGYPSIENVLLILLFPNSSIISESGIPEGSIAGYRPLLTRINVPEDVTVLFRPLKALDGNYFLTCFGSEETGMFSLDGLISAFDRSTWICFCLALILVPILFLKKVTRIKTIDIILNSISVMMEQGCFGNITKWSKWISGVWLFTGIILPNIYKGDNITSLIAPLPKGKLQRFDQIFQRNFTYFVSFHFVNMFAYAANSFPNFENHTVMKSEKVAEIIYKMGIKSGVYKSLNGNSYNVTSGIVSTVFSRIRWPQNANEMIEWSD